MMKLTFQIITSKLIYKINKIMTIVSYKVYQQPKDNKITMIQKQIQPKLESYIIIIMIKLFIINNNNLITIIIILNIYKKIILYMNIIKIFNQIDNQLTNHNLNIMNNKINHHINKVTKYMNIKIIINKLKLNLMIILLVIKKVIQYSIMEIKFK